MLHLRHQHICFKQSFLKYHHSKKCLQRSLLLRLDGHILLFWSLFFLKIFFFWTVLIIFDLFSLTQKCINACLNSNVCMVWLGTVPLGVFSVNQNWDSINIYYKIIWTFSQGFTSKKITYSYHSLMVTSAIPSPMSDNLKGMTSAFIPFNQNQSSASIITCIIEKT